MDKLFTLKKEQFVPEINKYLTENLNDVDNDDDEQTTSKAGVARTTATDENNAPVKKSRKVRSKDEIQKEKLEKEINKIHREVNASKNTKCELYLYCHCSNALLCLDSQIATQLKAVYTERKLDNQLVFEDMELAKIYWEKKRISAEIHDNAVVRSESFVGNFGRLFTVEFQELQFGFLIAIDGGSFKLMYESKRYDEFIDNALADHCAKFEGEVRMTIAVIGDFQLSDSKVNLLSLELFEKYKVQLRFCQTVEDFSYLVAQMHRTLAKFEKKLETSGTQIHLNVEKGIREGDNLTEDWWSRMLNHIYRLPEECRRAIVEIYPTPFLLMDKLDEMTSGDAMQHLADIECTNGRRVGPAIAQKLFLLMTSEDGTEIVDRPGINI